MCKSFTICGLYCFHWIRNVHGVFKYVCLVVYVLLGDNICLYYLLSIHFENLIVHLFYFTNKCVDISKYKENGNIDSNKK